MIYIILYPVICYLCHIIYVTKNKVQHKKYDIKQGYGSHFDFRSAHLLKDYGEGPRKLMDTENIGYPVFSVIFFPITFICIFIYFFYKIVLRFILFNLTDYLSNFIVNLRPNGTNDT